jgi:superfamily I DNA/RNA helicase
MTDLKNLCLPEYFVKHKNSNPLLDNFTSLEEFENHARTSQLVKWLLRINLWKKYESETVRHLFRAKQWYSPTGFTLITAHQSKGLEFDHVILCKDLRFDNPQASNLMYVALTRAKHTIHIPIKLLNYLFTKRNHLRIREAPAPKNKRCTLCKNRFTNQRQMVECDPDVFINHSCELHIIEPVCSQCATHHVGELAPKTWS